MRDLVLKARKDNAITERIVKSFEPLLKRCCSVYLKNPSDFEDGMQEGRIVILKCIKNYDERLNIPFEAYVKRAVINCIRDMAKRYKEHISLDDEVTEDGENFYEIIPSDYDLEEECIKEDYTKRLYRALEKLSPKQREVIIEHYFKGKSMIEIAKHRRCHYMAVVRLKDRAIERLRRDL